MYSHSISKFSLAGKLGAKFVEKVPAPPIPVVDAEGINMRDAEEGKRMCIY